MKPYIEMKVPSKFSFSPAEAADFLGIDVRKVRRNLARNPKDKHYLEHLQHTPGGSITIYAYHLEDYMKRVAGSYRREELETLQKVV